MHYIAKLAILLLGILIDPEHVSHDFVRKGTVIPTSSVYPEANHLIQLQTAGLWSVAN